jgi:hypothetical protein
MDVETVVVSAVGVVDGSVAQATSEELMILGTRTGGSSYLTRKLLV